MGGVITPLPTSDRTANATPSLYFASVCYGGVAHASFMRSLLALRAACSSRGVPLHLDLGGGEALVSRGRAGILAKFMGGEASHLLFADADTEFAPADVLELLLEREVATCGNLLLISRPAALALCERHPELQAGLGDVAGSTTTWAAMLFESVIEPQTGRYLSDCDAFCWRWRVLGGVVQERRR